MNTDTATIFNYLINFVFIIGIILYIYQLVVYHRLIDDDDVPYNEQVWIWGLFVLLIFGFIASSYY
jgi:hypothetical protein